MGDENQQQQNNKQPKTAAELLKQLEEKDYGSKLSQIKKNIEEKYTLFNKAQEALNQVKEELDALSTQYDECMTKKNAVRKSGAAQVLDKTV